MVPGVRCSAPSASAESFVYPAGVSQLTRSGGSASQLTHSKGGSQWARSEGGSMLPPTRSSSAVTVSSSLSRALSSAVGASDLFGAAEMSGGRECGWVSCPPRTLLRRRTAKIEVGYRLQRVSSASQAARRFQR
ncbi:hypothetical protein K438DRAFT_1937730 [Mycena galopus ATCC 62051]|nr:hypothetical protein K438DRAFT_1937730 [Mycena galopus ATCC 62051]